MKPLFVKFLFVLVVLIAFVDGILFARHWQETHPGEDVSPVIVDEMSEQISTIKTSEPLETTTQEELTTEEVASTEEETIVEEPINEWPVLNFTTQAPYGWFFPWTYYAEEASLVMALETFNTPNEAADAMSALASWEQSNLGNTKDSSIDELQRIVREYYLREAYIMKNPSIVSLITELDQGSLIVVSIYGPSLENPNYGNPAPEHHTFLIYGYTEEGFLVQDPGTVKGKAAVYDYEKTLEAIQDLDGEKRALLIQPS